MTKVIDTSVLLAALFREPGGEVLQTPGQLFHFSMVNLAEVYTKVAEHGGELGDVGLFMRPLSIRIRAFREDQAVEVGRLRPLTRDQGLSLGDRACLSVALLVDLPVLTADSKWADLDLGIDIRMIR